MFVLLPYIVLRRDDWDSEGMKSTVEVSKRMKNKARPDLEIDR